MRAMNKYVLATIVSATGVVVAGTAWAGIVPVITVPEPGLFGLVAGGTAAVIIAARLRNRK
jgi:hypothetical protein